MAALNKKDAGLSEVAALTVLVETLINLIETTNALSGAPLFSETTLQTAHSAADATAALARHGSRKFARQTS